ncbi:30S ribosomal protein S8e [Candidatus Woesearchaeota archaeon]|nr:30S ribosomal protein S8e [Candidatus Woesearchaeota archaeon]
MARSQQRSIRKVTGGLYRPSRGKKKNELAGYSAMTRLSEGRKTQVKRTPGGNRKISLIAGNNINVTDKKGKAVKTQILNVVENPANPNLVRRNILTKGAVVETKLGKARITSRPGQEGTVNGILLQ